MNMVTQQGRKEKRRMHSKSKPHTSGVASQIHRKAHKQIYMYHTLLSSSSFFFQIFRGTTRSLPLRKRWVALKICLQARVATLQVVGEVTRGGLVQHIRRIHAI